MSRNVFTIFSDDVRHEISGKTSYIGVYSGKLLAKSFPTILPKLCITLKITTPASNPFKSLTAKIYKDDEVIATGELPSEELDKNQDAIPSDDGVAAKKVSSVQMGFEFSPFVIDNPCMLRVRVENEGKELRGIGLRIEQAPDGMIIPSI